MASITKGGGGSKPTQSQSQAKAQVAADERRQTIVAAQVAAQRYVGQSGRDQRVTNPSRGEQAASARLTQQAAQQAAQQAKKQIIATEAKRDAARASQYAGITRNTGSATGGRTDDGTKKPGKPFRFTGNDPAPQFPNVPDRGPGGGGGGGGDPDPGPTITTFADIPNVSSTMSNPVPSQTLMPGRDVINFTEVASSPEAMQQILFEELSSYELVNMARGDTVEGLNPYYSVISNLSSLRRQYNPSQIISLQTPIQNSFDIYQISLIDKIPDSEYIQLNNIGDFFYIDKNGDFVIELVNMESDEVIEIQIATSGRII